MIIESEQPYVRADLPLLWLASPYLSIISLCFLTKVLVSAMSTVNQWPQPEVPEAFIADTILDWPGWEVTDSEKNTVGFLHIYE